MALTDTTIRQSKPQDKEYKLSDEKGLYLLIKPSGAKYWRLKYRYAGKEKTLSIGVYPEVSLKEARLSRDEARKLLIEGIDPSTLKQQNKAFVKTEQLNTFEIVGRQWLEFKKKTIATTTAKHNQSRLERFVFPFIGKKPIHEVSIQDISEVLERVSKQSLDNAHKTNQHCSQIFRFAIAKGIPARDICSDIKGFILQPLKNNNFPTLTEPKQLGQFLRDCHTYKHSLIVKNALLLAPLIFVRPSEMRCMKWSEVDLERREWKYLVTKTQTDHLVPLSKQAISILTEMQSLTGDCIYVFSAVGYKTRASKPFSEGTLNKAIRNLGYDTSNEITGHGFRAMARTLIAEQLRYPAEVIEHQLAHKVPDALGTAYNRTKFIDDRIKMMQDWADYLDSLRNESKNPQLERDTI